jgi:hypothetical protein
VLSTGAVDHTLLLGCILDVSPLAFIMGLAIPGPSDPSFVMSRQSRSGQTTQLTSIVWQLWTFKLTTLAHLALEECSNAGVTIRLRSPSLAARVTTSGKPYVYFSYFFLLFLTFLQKSRKSNPLYFFFTCQVCEKSRWVKYT